MTAYQGTLPIEVSRQMVEIAFAVARATGVPSSEIFGPSKSRQFARPRQISMWLAYKLTECSFPEIAKGFNRSDHTTAVHAVRTIDDLRANDDAIRQLTDRLWITLAKRGERMAARDEMALALSMSAGFASTAAVRPYFDQLAGAAMEFLPIWLAANGRGRLAQELRIALSDSPSDGEGHQVAVHGDAVAGD